MHRVNFRLNITIRHVETKHAWLSCKINMVKKITNITLALLFTKKKFEQHLDKWLVISR
jgi:hypothetical protein